MNVKPCDRTKEWYQHRRKEFFSERDAPLCDKVRKALRLIHEQHMRFQDRMVLASSFGKDSTVLMHLTLQMVPDIKIIFNNTGVEFKETLDHRDLLRDLYDFEYIEIKPPRTFFDIAREYGLPGETRSKTREPKCCQLLKTKPMRDWIRENNVEAIIVGILGSESYMREFAAVRDGQVYFAKSFWDCWKVHPLLYWTEQDVWDYHERYKLPINKAYEKYQITRTGCAPCTNHKLWERQVREWNPSLYKIIQRMKGQAVLDLA